VSSCDRLSDAQQPPLTDAQHPPVTSSQRDRLLDAVVQETVLCGYEATTVATLTARAHVSRTTFYEHFADKEECFLAAHSALAGRLATELASVASAGCASGQSWRAIIQALVGFAEAEADAFSIVTHEAMIVGSRGRRQREELLAALADTLEAAFANAPATAATPDIPAPFVIGGIIRLLGLQLRRGERPEQLLDGLLWWVDSYAVAPQTVRWRGARPTPTAVPAAEMTPRPLPPQPLPRGRHRLPEELVADVQRERILHAAAQTVREKSYAQTSVADIAAAAGISRESFYAHFAGKQEVFLATQQLIFEQLLAAVAGAFFISPMSWAERVWRGGRAFSAWVANQPGFAHFGFVEPYALGPEAAKRTDEMMLAFTVFLQDGRRQRPDTSPAPRAAAEAIACATMEIFAGQVGHVHEESPWTDSVTYMILAPYMEVEAANEFLDGKLG
jgi:AcrR family transcriptional regulator